jgi:hypothetical protein
MAGIVSLRRGVEKGAGHRGCKSDEGLRARITLRTQGSPVILDVLWVVGSYALLFRG